MARSLLPREHGAYLELAIPLIAATIATPTVAGAAIAVSACAAFLAYEPLAVALGARGPRRRAADGERARVRLAILAGIAAVAGLAGLVLAPHALGIAVLVAGAGGAAVAAIASKRAHTFAGELVAAIALTGASAVVLVAGGHELRAAAGWWLAWAIGFGTTVIAVHRVLARHKQAATAIDRVLPVAMLGGAVALALSTLAIAAPLAAVSGGIALAPPRANRLRAVGIAFAVVAAGSAALGVIALR